MCKELRRLYYSYWIAGYITSKIKQLSFNLIGWIKSKKSLQEIKAEIDKKMDDDNVINRMRENLENDVYETSWLKSLLALLEYEQTDESKVEYIDIYDRKIQVDHILPQGWQSSKSWGEKFTTELANKWLNKIGNLTLLFGRKNIQARNSSFEEKKKIYKGKGIDGLTAFRISQDLLNKADWTEREIMVRQDQMIRDVKKILGITLT